MWRTANTARVQDAVHVCNLQEIKDEILLLTDSDNESGLFGPSPSDFWKSIEEKAAAVLPGRCIAKKRIPDGMRFLPAVGMRMLIWAEYHEGIFNLTPGYSAEFLNASFFTQRGIIDSKATAKALIDCGETTVKEKYKLACLHCFVDRINALYRKMSEKEKEEFYDAQNPNRIMQPGLVKFWTYYFMDDVDKLRGDKAVDEYKLEVIVESGNPSAIEYWLKKTDSRKKDIIKVALKTVGRKLNTEWVNFRDSGVDTWNWIVFRRRREYKGIEKFSTPSDHYVDVVAFLLSHMKSDQRVKFLREDIESAEYERAPFVRANHSNVLYFFLHWPYQYVFMKTARAMWDFLPGNSYAYLLLKIADKIEPNVRDYLKHGEERTYDYRRLLKEFWEESPEKLKRHVLSNYYIAYDRYSGIVGTCTELLKKLLSLSDVPLEHIKMILMNATTEEKEHIFSSAEWIEICVFLMKFNWKVLDEFVINDLLKDTGKWKVFFLDSPLAHSACIELMENGEWEAANSFIKWSSSPEKETELRERIVATEAWKRACCRLMDEEKWDELDEFLRKYFHSEEKINEFKVVFTSREDVKYFFLSKFIQKCRWDAAESFLKFSSLDEDEVYELKRNIIWSWRGLPTLCNLIRKRKRLEDIERCIRWYNASEHEAKFLKMSLIFCDEAMLYLTECAERGEFELANEFINFCLTDEDAIKTMKGRVGNEKGCGVLKNVLISGKAYLFDTEIEPCNWELAEKFLHWCFSSEEEINSYKRNVLLEFSGMEIHFALIVTNQWQEAEAFFDWLSLSPDEINEFKKITLLYHAEAKTMLYSLAASDEDDDRFVAYGGKEETIEMLLRWYLTDREALEEFRRSLDFSDAMSLTHEQQRKACGILDSAITKLLNDLN